MRTSFSRMRAWDSKRRDPLQLIASIASSTTTMDALQTLKSEGNALFQLQRFAEAVQVYSSVINQLRDSGAVDEVAVRLDTAVRLNRAWAWIQMPESSESSLAAAELDCSVVIDRDPSCVKAFYRRALARERRGQWKLAMDDAATMKLVEPTNPFIGPLLERLQQHSEEEKDLVPKLQQCSIDTSKNALAGEAEDAWRTLQEAEKSIRKVYQTSLKRSSASRRKPKRAHKDKKLFQIGLHAKGEISEKTDDLWEALSRDEVTPVAKAFPRSRNGAAV